MVFKFCQKKKKKELTHKINKLKKKIEDANILRYEGVGHYKYKSRDMQLRDAELVLDSLGNTHAHAQ